MISPPRQHAESRNLGQTLLGSPVHLGEFAYARHKLCLLGLNIFPSLRCPKSLRWKLVTEGSSLDLAISNRLTTKEDLSKGHFVPIIPLLVNTLMHSTFYKKILLPQSLPSGRTGDFRRLCFCKSLVNTAYPASVLHLHANVERLPS